MRSRWAAVVVAVLLVTTLPGQLAAQIAAGDSAWAAENYYLARIAYERALRDDSTSVRALYRLGILASWDGLLDSALVLLHRARSLKPGDTDVRLQEATVLAWASRYPESLARYDALLSEDPANRGAALGRARTLSWAGRLDEADSAYGQMIQRDGSDLEALAGRGQVALWRGDRAAADQWYSAALAQQPTHVPSLLGLAQLRQAELRLHEATAYADRAVTLAPNDRNVQRTAAEIRAMRRARLEIGLGWSRDSDKNVLWWQTLGTSLVPWSHVRAFGSVGLGEASDPYRTGTRTSMEAGATYDFGRATATAALGLRSLAPDSGDNTLLPTWRVAGGYRVSDKARVGAGYARYAFDETALLIREGLHIDDLSAEGDVTLRPGLSLGSGVGLAFLEDGNRRMSAVASVSQDIADNYVAGLFGRVMGYKQDGFGYFAPDIFFVTEGRGTYKRAMGPWNLRLSTGLGIQQAGSAASVQFEYHFEGRVARQWGVINEIALSGGLTNSAVSSTTGAFRYYTALLTARIGL